MLDVVRPGDRGEQVIDIQGRLVALGYAVSAEERVGVFGDTTTAAVGSFQTDRGIDVDGLVGPITWRELVEASWRLGDRILYLRAPHMRGDDIRDLQDRLSSLGFDPGRTDGILGPQTVRALEEFQRNYGIKGDGIVADDTIRALNGLPRMSGDTPVGHVRQMEALRNRPGSVAGMRIVLDPGHGGGDAGHEGRLGTREADVAFDIAHSLDAALAAAGAHVFLTRRAEDAPDPAARASLANALEADLFLSIHVGDGSTGGGARASYFGHSRWRSEGGAALARVIVEEVTKLGLSDGGTHAKTLPLLRETRMPAVVLECGVLPGDDDEKLLADPFARERVASAIATAFLRFAREPVSV